MFFSCQSADFHSAGADAGHADWHREGVVFQKVHIRDTVKILLLACCFFFVALEDASAWLPLSGLLAVVGLGLMIGKRNPLPGQAAFSEIRQTMGGSGTASVCTGGCCCGLSDAERSWGGCRLPFTARLDEAHGRRRNLPCGYRAYGQGAALYGGCLSAKGYRAGCYRRDSPDPGACRGS